MNSKECLVVNCKEKFENNLENVIFYCLPEDEEVRKKWLTKCGRQATYDCSKSFVCSRHFCCDDLEKDKFSLNYSLRRGAVPHLKLTEIKQEPLDSDYYDNEDQLSSPPSTNSLPDTVVFKTEVDDSFFENAEEVKESHPNTETSLVPYQVNLNPPIINCVSSSSAACAPSSLPASQNWPGMYDFTVSFGPQQKTTKGVSWTYSKMKDKLYVGKDAACPINFSAKVSNANDFVIRATALYSSPEHASEVVHRCVNHSMIESSKGVFEAEHLVRCESHRTTYAEDQTTKRHSVIVPFENPPAGQLYSTYLYKFTCFGSCAGGPNRRPLMLIFSLEKGNTVVGRRKLDVKICACPGRDRKAEEQQLLAERHPQLPVKRKEQETTSLEDVLQFTKNITLPPSSKKLKTDKSGPYHLSICDKDCYDFLKQMKKFYEMCKTVNGLPPSVKNALMHHAGRLKGTKKIGPDNEESDTDQ